MKLQTYQCHKQVQAGEIIMIDRGQTSRLYFAGLETAYVDVDLAWMNKRRPQVGGYYVVYTDGYASYSPAKAFEDGYTLVK